MVDMECVVEGRRVEKSVGQLGKSTADASEIIEGGRSRMQCVGHSDEIGTRWEEDIARQICTEVARLPDSTSTISSSKLPVADKKVDTPISIV